MRSPVQYSERLSVPLRWWAQGTMLVAMLWIAVVVAAPLVVSAAVALVAMGLVVTFYLSYGGTRISVVEGEFRAGRAHISTGLIGAAEALDAAETRRKAGVDADARAYLLLRPYLKRSVLVEITDPADPTPYWLVSTRNPVQLAAALESAAFTGSAGGSAG